MGDNNIMFVLNIHSKMRLGLDFCFEHTSILCPSSKALAVMVCIEGWDGTENVELDRQSLLFEFGFTAWQS